jgi:hypothetical protein
VSVRIDLLSGGMIWERYVESYRLVGHHLAQPIQRLDARCCFSVLSALSSSRCSTSASTYARSQRSSSTAARNWSHSGRSSQTGGFEGGLLGNRLPTSRSDAQKAVNSKDSSVHAIAIRNASVNTLSAPSTGSPLAPMRLQSEWANREPYHRRLKLRCESRRVRGLSLALLLDVRQQMPSGLMDAPRRHGLSDPEHPRSRPRTAAWCWRPMQCLATMVLDASWDFRRLRTPNSPVSDPKRSYAASEMSFHTASSSGVFVSSALPLQ